MTTQKQYYFLSGLPRTGSTILASILNQNKRIHTSATSALLDLLIAQANAVQLNRQFYEISDATEIELYHGMFNSYYKHIDKPVIFDKHRAWPSLVTALHKMNINSKIICTNRPISEIVTSYITLINKNPTSPNFIDELITNRKLEINTYNRAMTVWNDYVKIPYGILTEAIKNNRKNLLFINYDDIVNNPTKVLSHIGIFFNIDMEADYNFEKIVNNQPEKDENGWKLKDLHTIRPELKSCSVSPTDAIGKDLTDYFNEFNLKY